jgi:hypothetical protein
MTAPGPEDEDGPDSPESDPDLPDPDVPGSDAEEPDYTGYEPDYPEDYPDEDWEYEEGSGEARPRDSQIDAAKTFLMDEFFRRYPNRVFYSQQIQVLLEDDWAIGRIVGERRPGFFHWITGKALRELAAEGSVRSQILPLGEYRPGLGDEIGEDHGGTTIRYFWSRKNRYTPRAIERSLKLVRTFSAAHLSHAIGNNGENMFDAALPKVGFMPRGENVKDWTGKKWSKTREDLDRVFAKDGVSYGAEIKNTLSYIRKETLQSKLEMCKFLGLVPLFILRACPKSYVHLINNQGGFALVFRYQMYPVGQEALVEAVRETLMLPVGSPRAVELGTVERLLKWHRWKFKKYE